MKIRVSNGAGQVAEFEVPEENLWLDVIDSRGEAHWAGSLFVQQSADTGAVRIELGAAAYADDLWEPANPVVVHNETLFNHECRARSLS
ncbi:hypothetical protein [Microbacterium sp. NPDC096154]|uniref:hypothetical protein n=1 Tax=Microbacterium sp. NPDC096154 TaxID=3155549 RepID=UPI00331E11EB